MSKVNVGLMKFDVEHFGKGGMMGAAEFTECVTMLRKPCYSKLWHSCSSWLRTHFAFTVGPVVDVLCTSCH